MRKFILKSTVPNAILLIAGVLVGAGMIYAASSYRVGGSGSQQVTVNEHGTCKKVTNYNANDVFVPTNTSGEWAAFRDNAPNVSLNECLETMCSFNGTWYYWDAGEGNDFAATCRNGTITGICGSTPSNTRGLKQYNYSCEYGSTPTDGTINCAFEGTWYYYDQGFGNDWGATCRSGKITGYCGSTPPNTRGFFPNNYSCENGPVINYPTCNYDGTWYYYDEGAGNDFAATCRNGTITGICGSTPPNTRGLNAGNYACETTGTLFYCSDGIDNDSDGYIDGADKDCLNMGTEGWSDATCSNGEDDDWDGYIDFDDDDCLDHGAEDGILN